MPDSPSKANTPSPAGPPASLSSFFRNLGNRARSTSQYGSLNSVSTASTVSTPSSTGASGAKVTASDKLSSLLAKRSSFEEDHPNHHASHAGTTAPGHHAAPAQDTFKDHYSATRTAKLAMKMSREDEALLWIQHTLQQLRKDGQADPAEVWSLMASLLQMVWSQPISMAAVELLRTCVSLSNEGIADARAGYIRYLYYEQVKSAFQDASDTFDEAGLASLVAVLETLTRGGRDILGLEGLIPLLLNISTRLVELRQIRRIRHLDITVATAPLLDPTFSTPFVRLPPDQLFISSDPKYSPGSLVIACHRFSFSHIRLRSIEAALHLFTQRGMQSVGEHEAMKGLELVDTVIKFGYVPPKLLEDAVRFVARVAGLEGRCKVIEVSPDGQRREVDLPDTLPNKAHDVMRNLLRSPANQALRHLRGILSTRKVWKNGSLQCPTPMLIGAVRCFRKAYKEYESIIATLSAEEHSKSSDRYPSLLQLGMTVMHQNMLDVLEWQSADVDSEVLLFLEERFSSRAADKQYFSYEEWEMVISVLEKATWHIADWESSTGRPWHIEAGNIDQASQRKYASISSKSEASPAAISTSSPSPAASSPQGTNSLPVLASFSLVINRMLVAQSLDTFTGSHLRFFDFLLSIARHLSSSALVSFFNFYQARQLVSPGRGDWIKRLSKIVRVFFPQIPYAYMRDTVKSGRKSALELLTDAYNKAQGYPEYVASVMDRVLLPFFDDHLPNIRDTTVAEVGFALMTKCAMDSMPVQGPAEESEERLQKIISVLKRVSWLHPYGSDEAGAKAITIEVSPDRSMQAASKSSIADLGCHAALLLIRIFHECIIASNAQCSMIGLDIFQHLLDLVSTVPRSSVRRSHATKKTRFTVLQCLVRLRADKRHRIVARESVDFEELAKQIGRTSTAGQAGEGLRVSIERGRTQARREKLASGAVDQVSSSHSSKRTGASQSRTRASKSEASPHRARARDVPEQMLWKYPETIPFTASRPVQSTGANGIVSFDHINMRDWQEAIAVNEPDESFIGPASGGEVLIVLPVSDYLEVIESILLQEDDWDLVSYVLCALPNQLANKHFACGPRAARRLQRLRQSLCEHLNRDTLGQQVELPPRVKRSDMHAVAYQWLATLIAYRDLFVRDKQNEMVITFLRGLSKTPNIAKPSIHALTMACYEFENSMSKYLPEILSALVRIMSTVNMAVHILELVASIGHIKSLYANFTEDDYKKVFAIGVQYLSMHYENLLDNPDSAIVPEDLESAITHAFGQYVFLLSFYVIALWYTVIPVSERGRYTSFVVNRLLRAIESHKKLDAATEVSLDMLSRLAYSSPSAQLMGLHGSCSDDYRRHWIVANAILTIEAPPDAKEATVVIRRPSGVLKKSIPWASQDLASISILDILAQVRDRLQHKASVQIDVPYKAEESVFEADSAFFTLFLPPYTHINDYGLPRSIRHSDQTRRSINVLDSMPHIDSHKIGVLYVGPGQDTEQDILRNVHGSDGYIAFLSGLGDLVRLQGYKSYAGGLDREADFDGKFAYMWSDDIQQIIFHVATLMPTRIEQDPQSSYKKRHIGNDYVKIIFNDSGSPLPFDIIPGQFNFVNLIIEPHTPVGEAWRSNTGIANNTEFFRVSLQQRADMPELGPLGIFKMVSTASLPAFVRELALHANLFAQLFLQSVGVEGKSSSNRQKVEYTSTWRNRLEAINRLRDLVDQDERLAKEKADKHEDNIVN